MSGRNVILVVEDDDTLRFSACSADEALQMIGARADIGLVFSDMHMPGRDGVELAAAIGRDHPAIAVALTSGDTLTNPPLEGVIMVQKPWRLDELRELVKQLLPIAPKS